MKTIDIHGKPYVMVKDRVVHFNQENPNGCIKTKKMPSIDNIVVFEATVIPDIENAERFFTGHAEEEIGSSQINKTSALENCETSAVGRALAMMGIGADESFASADEVANAISQQNGTKTTSTPIQDTPKTSKNAPICPDCGKDVIDNRLRKGDGYSLKPSKAGDTNQPAWKCVDNTYPDPSCGFKSYKIDEFGGPSEDKPKQEYTAEQLNDLNSNYTEQSSEEMFNEL